MGLKKIQLVFKVTLKNLEIFEICVLGTKETNINIRVTLKIAQNVSYFSQMLCKWCCQNFLVGSYGEDFCFAK